MSTKTIAIASDHAGFSLKEELKQCLTELGNSALDLGARNHESVDYPDFGYALSAAIKASTTFMTFPPAK